MTYLCSVDTAALHAKEAFALAGRRSTAFMETLLKFLVHLMTTVDSFLFDFCPFARRALASVALSLLPPLLSLSPPLFSL